MRSVPTSATGDAAPDPPPGFSIECRQLVELITDYLEGDLDDASRREFEAHLSVCPPCGDYLAQIRTTLRMLGRVPLDALSEPTKAGLVDAFRKTRPPLGHE